MTTTLIATPDRKPEPKTGDKVRIINVANGHGYEIGEIVTLGKYHSYSNGGYWDGVEGLRWAISKDNFVVVEPAPLSPVEEGEQARRRRYIEEIEGAGLMGRLVMGSATTSQLRQLAELVKEINS